MLVVANTFMHSVTHYAHYLQQKSTRWPSGNELDSGTVGLGSNPGSVKLESANGSPLLQLFFERSCVVQAQCRAQWAPQTHFTLQRNTVRANENLIF